MSTFGWGISVSYNASVDHMQTTTVPFALDEVSFDTLMDHKYDTSLLLFLTFSTTTLAFISPSGELGSELQEARAAGCRTRVEADTYLAQKKKKESEANARKAKETGQLAANGKVLQRANRPIKGESEGSPRSAVDNHKIKTSTGLESGGKDSSSTTTGANAKSLDEWDITGLPGADLLTETEQELCRQNKLLPSHYLKMLEVFMVEAMTGNITKRSDAYRLFKVDTNKVDRVYDMAVKKGLVQRDDTPIA